MQTPTRPSPIIPHVTSISVHPSVTVKAKAVHLVSPNETADDESHLSTHPTQLLPCALTPSRRPPSDSWAKHLHPADCCMCICTYNIAIVHQLTAHMAGFFLLVSCPAIPSFHFPAPFSAVSTNTTSPNLKPSHSLGCMMHGTLLAISHCASRFSAA
jgi:hypothetical protein